MRAGGGRGGKRHLRPSLPWRAAVKGPSRAGRVVEAEDGERTAGGGMYVWRGRRRAMLVRRADVVVVVMMF